jgi:hypothetical protein
MENSNITFESLEKSDPFWFQILEYEIKPYWFNHRTNEEKIQILINELNKDNEFNFNDYYMSDESNFETRSEIPFKQQYNDNFELYCKIHYKPLILKKLKKYSFEFKSEDYLEYKDCYSYILDITNNNILFRISLSNY